MKDQFTDYNKQPVIDKYEEPRNIFVSIQSVKNMCTNKLELHIKSQFMAKVGFCDWYSDESFIKKMIFYRPKIFIYEHWEFQNHQNLI